jgi:hypothetical protein
LPPKKEKKQGNGQWAKHDSEAQKKKMEEQFARLRDQSHDAATVRRAQHTPAPASAQNAAPSSRSLPTVGLSLPATEDPTQAGSVNPRRVAANRASFWRKRVASQERLLAPSSETTPLPLLRYSPNRQEFLDQTRPIYPPEWAPPSEVPTEAHVLLAQMEEGDDFWYTIRRHCPDDRVATGFLIMLEMSSSCAGGSRRGQRVSDSSLRVATSVGTVAAPSSISTQVELPSSSTSPNVIREVVPAGIPRSTLSTAWDPRPEIPSPLARVDPSIWPEVIASRATLATGARNRSYSLPPRMLLAQGRPPVENAAPPDEDTVSWERYCGIYPELKTFDHYSAEMMGRQWFPQDDTPIKKKGHHYP